MLQEQNKKPNQKELEREKGLVDSGAISALDLAAPGKAVKEFNQASSLLRGQHSQEAIAICKRPSRTIPSLFRPTTILAWRIWTWTIRPRPNGIPDRCSWTTSSPPPT